MKFFKAVHTVGWTVLFVTFISCGCIGSEKPAVNAEKTVTETAPSAAAPAEAAPAAPVSAPEGKDAALVFDDDAADEKDPFRPVFKPWQPSDEPEPENCPAIALPRNTPLEFIPLEQLKLKGVVLTEKGNHALIEDAAGKPYIIHLGTKVGTHWGIVTKISKGELSIEEKYTDEDCNIVSEDRLMKLPQRPST